MKSKAKNWNFIDFIFGKNDWMFQEATSSSILFMNKFVNLNDDHDNLFYYFQGKFILDVMSNPFLNVNKYLFRCWL